MLLRFIYHRYIWFSVQLLGNISQVYLPFRHWALLNLISARVICTISHSLVVVVMVVFDRFLYISEISMSPLYMSCLLWSISSSGWCVNTALSDGVICIWLKITFLNLVATDSSFTPHFNYTVAVIVYSENIVVFCDLRSDLVFYDIISAFIF